MSTLISQLADAPTWMSNWATVAAVPVAVLIGVPALMLTLRTMRANEESRRGDLLRASQAEEAARNAANEQQVVRQVGAFYQELLRMPAPSDYFRDVQPWTPAPSEVARYLSDLAPVVRAVDRQATDRRASVLADRLPKDHPLRMAVQGGFKTYLDRLNILLLNAGSGLDLVVDPDDQPNFLLYLHSRVEFTLPLVVGLMGQDPLYSAATLNQYVGQERLELNTIRILARGNWFAM